MKHILYHLTHSLSKKTYFGLVLLVGIFGFAFNASAWVLDPWVNPTHLSEYEITDDIVVDGNWTLSAGEVAVISIFIDGVEQDRLYIVPTSTLSGTFSRTYPALDYGTGSHTISLTETRALIADCPDPNNCSGDYAAWLARTFIVKLPPDPVLVFSLSSSPPAYNFGRHDIAAPPATTTFLIKNVGYDMASGTYAIDVVSEDTPGSYSCIIFATSTCSYSGLASGEQISVTIAFDPVNDAHQDGYADFPLGNGSTSRVTLDGRGALSTDPYGKLVYNGRYAAVVLTPNNIVNYEGATTSIQFADMYTGEKSANGYARLYFQNVGLTEMTGELIGLSAQDEFYAASYISKSSGVVLNWSGDVGKSDAQYTIPPNGYFYMYYYWLPTEVNGHGMREVVLSFTNDTTGEQVDLELSGFADNTPILDSETTTIEVGSHMIGASGTQAVRIGNIGGGTLNATATVSSASGYFSGLMPGGTCATCTLPGLNNLIYIDDEDDWAIEFTPLTGGEFYGLLEYTTNAGVATRTLHGYGIELLISPGTSTSTSGNPTNPTVGYNVYNDQYYIDFGDVLAGDTITANFDTSAAITASAPINGEFTVVDPYGEFDYVGTNTYSIPVGGSDSVSISFAPDIDNGIGARRGTTTFDGLPNYPGGEMDIELRANVIAPEIRVHNAAQDFGQIKVGASTTKVFYVENVGEGMLNGELSISGGPFYCDDKTEMDQHKTVDSFGPIWQDGVEGSALNLTGEYGLNDYIRVDDVSGDLDITSNEITLSAWVRSNDKPIDDEGIIVKESSAVSSYSLMLDGSFGVEKTKAMFQIETDLGLFSIRSSTPIIDGFWHHVVGVYDGVRMQLYLDGDLVESQDWSGNIVTNSEPLLIGRRDLSVPNDRYELNGLVDEIRVYDRGLSPAEVQALYNRSGESNSNLVGYWTFNEGTGDIIADSSSSGNDGAVVYTDSLVENVGFTTSYANGIGNFDLLTTGDALLRWGAPPFIYDQNAGWPLYMWTIDHSYDIFEMRYKNYIGGPDTVTLYYADTPVDNNNDCRHDDDPACSQSFSIVNSDTDWHTLSEKITDPEWVNYNNDFDWAVWYMGYTQSTTTAMHFSGQSSIGPISFDYVRFKQDPIPACEYSVASNEGRYIPVTFEPLSTGYHTATATFTGRGDNPSVGPETQEVPLTGFATGGSIFSVDPLFVDYGIVFVGQDGVYDFTLYNPTGMPIVGEILDLVPRAVAGGGDGLVASYYDDNSVATPPDGLSPLVTWVDRTVNLDLPKFVSPHPTQYYSTYGISWDGQIEAPETGDFIFSLGDPASTSTVDDYMWLWINDELIASCDSTIDPCTASPTPMVAGHFYDIRVAFTQWSLEAAAKLFWQTPSSGSFSLVPQSVLYTHDTFATINNGVSGGVALTQPFTCDVGCSYNLPAYSFDTRTIRFTPPAGNNYDRTVYFGGANGQTVKLDAEGSVAPFQEIEILNASGTVVATCVEDTNSCAYEPYFGEINVGEQNEYFFKVINRGQSDLDGFVGPIVNTAYKYAVGTDVNYVAITTDASTTYEVIFRPSPFDVGTSTQTLVFTNSVTGATISINLEATGIYEPIVAVGGGELNFGAHRVGSTARRTFRIIQTGRDSLTDHWEVPPGVFGCEGYEVVEETTPGVWTAITPYEADCSVDFTVNRNQAVELDLHFSPIEIKKYSETMFLAGIPEVQLQLSGTGISPIEDFLFEER